MKKILLIVLTLISFLSCSRNFSNNSEEYNAIQKSESYFQKAMVSEIEEEKDEYFYRSASLLEELISTQKVDNGYIYYNAANSWMNSGNLGKAILNYRKAELRIPSNHIVRNNLSVARLSVENLIERKDQNALLKTLFFIHYDISFGTRVHILVSLVFIIFSSASIRLFKKKKYLRNIQIIGLFCLLCFSISVFIDILKPHEGVIIYKEVTARKGDSDGYENSFTQDLTEGVEFIVISERNQWFYIELSDGNTCWIPMDSAELIH